MSLMQPSIPTDQVPKWVTVDGKRFRAVSYEALVDSDIDAVWAELADNYVNIDRVSAPITDSYVIPGAPETGPGAARHCDINFNGKEIEVKERIIDWIDRSDHKEYTYDVYESLGFPAKVFNTWLVRVAPDGKTYLRNVFYFRMKPAIMTRLSTRSLRKAARNGVLGYKHFLETGEGKVHPSVLAAQYAA